MEASLTLTHVSSCSAKAAEGAEPSLCPAPASDSPKPQCADLQSEADITEKKVII